MWLSDLAANSGFLGIVLKSFPCTLAENEQSKERVHLHLVLADSLDAKDLATNAKFSDITHRDLGGTLYDFDLVETSEMMPYKNGHSPIFNESLPKYFNRVQTAHIRLVATLLAICILNHH